MKTPSTATPALRRIALFLHGLSEGGAQRRALSLAQNLVERGLAVDLLVVEAQGPLRPLLAPGVEMRVIGQPWADWPWIRSHRGRQVRVSIPSLVAYLRRERPDVLVSAANHTALATVRAHRWAQVPETALVLRVSNALTSRRRNNQWLRKRSMQGALRHVDAVATVSQALATEVAELCTDRPPPIRTVVNPVIDPARIAAAAQLAPAWTDDGRPVIVGVGRLVPQKDFSTLIRAFAPLADRMDLRLVIIGDGPERDALGALAASLGVADRVSLPGRLADPLPSLHRGRLFVLSSRWEGLPGSLIEAMACGCAVVSTDCSGAREVLLDGTLAPMVAAGDVAALSQVMERALTQPADTQALRRRAQEFSFKPATDDFIDVLRLAQRQRLDKRSK